MDRKINYQEKRQLLSHLKNQISDASRQQFSETKFHTKTQ